MQAFLAVICDFVLVFVEMNSAISSTIFEIFDI